MITDNTDNKVSELNLATIPRAKLARAVGADIAHISRILSRKSRPGLDLAVRIAKYLEITVEELLELLKPD